MFVDKIIDTNCNLKVGVVNEGDISLSLTAMKKVGKITEIN